MVGIDSNTAEFIEGLNDGDRVQTQEVPAGGKLRAGASTLKGRADGQRSLSAGRVSCLEPGIQ